MLVRAWMGEFFWGSSKASICGHRQSGSRGGGGEYGRAGGCWVSTYKEAEQGQDYGRQGL